VHHSLASSQYNLRRKECEQGLEILKKELNIQSFRDIKNSNDLLSFKAAMGENVYKRCVFVVEEINRTKKAAELLKENDLAGFGKLMFDTHEGLKDQYEVSCKELDFLADKAKENKGVIGARLMGGGFGGCTINIVKDNGIDNFLSTSLTAYKKQFNIEAEYYEVKVVDGTNNYVFPVLF